MTLVGRTLVSVGAVAVYGAVSHLWSNVAMLEAGNLAPTQFQSSDVAYLVSSSGMHFFASGTPGLVLALGLCVVLGAIWLPTVKSIFVKENNNA